MGDILELDKLTPEQIRDLKEALKEDHQDRIINMTDVQLKNFEQVLVNKIAAGTANKVNLATILLVREELEFRKGK